MVRIFHALRIVSMACVIFMMVLTGVDVILRITFNQLIFGAVELIELALVGLVFLALPETFWRDEQISVDLIDQVAPPEVVTVARIVAQVITALLLAVMTWRMLPPALDTVDFGDTTTDLQIPMIWHWIPMVLGAAAATVAAIAVLIRQIKTHGKG